MSNKYRLLKSFRLREKSEFDAVFASRKRINSPYCVLRYNKNNLDCSRLGVISSKKNIRFAVNRNKLRRIIREQFRLHQYELCGYDIVIVVHRAANELSSGEFHQCIKHLFNTLQSCHKKY